MQQWLIDIMILCAILVAHVGEGKKWPNRKEEKLLKDLFHIFAVLMQIGFASRLIFFRKIYITEGKC